MFIFRKGGDNNSNMISKQWSVKNVKSACAVYTPHYNNISSCVVLLKFIWRFYGVMRPFLSLCVYVIVRRMRNNYLPVHEQLRARTTRSVQY